MIENLSHSRNNSWNQLSRYLWKNWFHEIFAKTVKIRFRYFRNPNVCTVHHSMEMTEFYCHRFLAIFPSNQRFTKELYCKSIWRKKLRGSEFLVFPHFDVLTWRVWKFHNFLSFRFYVKSILVNLEVQMLPF